jgi:hypothetical protein
MTGIISGLTGGAAALFGGNAAKRASRKAQDAEVAAQNAAIAKSDETTGKITSMYDPYAAVGTGAASKLTTGLGDLTRSFGANDFQEDPGYQFRLGEGQRAIDRRAGANGQYFAPATLKDLSDYSGSAASAEYQNAYDRFNNDQNSKYQKLLGLANFGMGATSDIAGAMTHGSDTDINSILGIGDAKQAGLRERGAISAKQWTEGMKSANTLLSSAKDNGGIVKSLGSLATSLAG